jgi:t-SNARE complex subunit (syntaxin)
LIRIKQKDEKILDTTQFQQEKKSKERFNELLQHFKDIQAKHAQFKTTEV